MTTLIAEAYSLLAEIPRMTSRLVWTVAIFWIAWKPEWKVWTAPGIKPAEIIRRTIDEFIKRAH